MMQYKNIHTLRMETLTVSDKNDSVHLSEFIS